MNWARLKLMRCPLCYGNLLEKKNIYYCEFNDTQATDSKCKFLIGKNKFNEIVSSLYSKMPRSKERVMEEQDNFNRLQNLDDHCNDDEESGDD